MTSPATPVVQTAGLTKIFRDFWHRPKVRAVSDLDIEIHPREVFGLLGPNGSGKTTTIKILLGLLYPTRGRVAVFEQPPTDVAVKARIGFLPEESYLYRFLNARETLEYYGRLLRLPRQERRRRVEQLLDMVGLAAHARRPVGEYSKGMARRIGLAQALINDPDLLILDEPTSGLDPIGTRQIKDLILLLNQEKHKTVLLSSHLLADVEDVCRRVAILNHGRRIVYGPIQDLLARQELTQITTEKLSDATVERLRSVVREAGHGDAIEVKTPTDKLETFFVRVVAKAQAQARQPAGVRIAPFLAERGDETAVIESLVRGGSAPEPKAEPESAPTFEAEPASAQAQASEVIEGLVADDAAARSEARDGDQPDEAAPSCEPEQQVDQSLIDSLTAHKRDPED